ncbi:phosphopantetheine-binding protein [Amycolatopsis sp. QT-25]|uniref:acyl carrier protein n=1 Tax=Amycolatopsis sp. QT-25 TaxID=3034022 RepID=UPI0023EB3CD4|nr:phosphopantetheine-binding protein [Amycolatopsis sp. QT-25]WET76284.1 phosphopantetheine-binding protein [Amycolatopsis sp. QT-25]
MSAEPSTIDDAVRDNLSRVLSKPVEPAEIDPDRDLADGYGLTSMQKVMFLMSACDDTGVGLETFTEPDVAAMRTLRDVTHALAGAVTK